MPSKCCFFITLGFAYNLLGLFNWLGTIAGVAVLIARFNLPIVMGWYYELGAMLIVANLIPALAWFASVFSPKV